MIERKMMTKSTSHLLPSGPIVTENEDHNLQQPADGGQLVTNGMMSLPMRGLTLANTQTDQVTKLA